MDKNKKIHVKDDTRKIRSCSDLRNFLYAFSVPLNAKLMIRNDSQYYWTNEVVFEYDKERNILKIKEADEISEGGKVDFL